MIEARMTMSKEGNMRSGEVILVDPEKAAKPENGKKTCEIVYF